MAAIRVRPLDLDSAVVRAAQTATLADPLRLRVLSAIAVAPTGEGSAALLRDQLVLNPSEVRSALAALESAGLVASHGRRGVRLTGEAWIRFGPLLTGEAVGDPGPVDLAELPEVVHRIARRLEVRYSSVFAPESVRRYVAESYALLAERARIRTYLPTLTEKFASDRLSALATATGLTVRGVPEVLFVCLRNAGRSQLAAAILRHLAGEQVHVRTAGSAPASWVDPLIVEVLDEIEVTMPLEFPKPLTDEVVWAADHVITMGCGDACPVYPGRRYMDWTLTDPAGLPKDGVRRVRDEVHARVEGLISDLGLAGTGSPPAMR